MAAARKFGREDSATRSMMLDALQDILVEQGYSAVTSRRIADRVGVTHQSVFYYFASLDDLLLALIDRNALSFRERLRAAREHQHPLRALWDIALDRESGIIELQLKALAVHNERIRNAMSENLAMFRAEATEALAATVGPRHPGDQGLPAAAAFAIEGLGRYLVLDHFMAIDAGHNEIRTFVDRLIEPFDHSSGDPMAGAGEAHAQEQLGL